MLLDMSFAGAQAPDTMWTRAYNDTLDQTAADVCQYKDGFVIVGSKMIPGQGNYDVYLMKIDGSGAIEWTRTYGGPGYDIGGSICTTLDGNLVVAANSNYQVYLLKINGLGDTLWTGKYNIGNSDMVYAVKEARDGGLIVAAVATDPGEYANMGILKVNALGQLQWARSFGGTGEDKAFNVYATRDGNFALVGYRELGWGVAPAWLIMVGPHGDSLWSRYYERGICDFAGIDQTPDDGFILAGRSTIGIQNWWDVYVVRTNLSGDTLWTRAFGGPQWDGAFHVESTPDGDFFVGAYTFSFGGDVDYYFLKLDSLGNLIWQSAWGSDQYDWSQGAIHCWDGGYIMVGRQELTGPNGGDVYVVRLNSDGYVNINGPFMPGAFSAVQNYPNPFNAQTTISYSLPQEAPVAFEAFDIAGRRIYAMALGNQGAGIHSFTWNANALPSGIYLYRIKAGSHSITNRCLLLK